MNIEKGKWIIPIGFVAVSIIATFIVFEAGKRALIMVGGVLKRPEPQAPQEQVIPKLEFKPETISGYNFTGKEIEELIAEAKVGRDSRLPRQLPYSFFVGNADFTNKFMFEVVSNRITIDGWSDLPGLVQVTPTLWMKTNFFQQTKTR